MHRLPTLVLLAACSGSSVAPVPPATPVLPFDQTGAGEVLQLDRLAPVCMDGTARADQVTREPLTQNGFWLDPGARCTWEVSVAVGSRLDLVVTTAEQRANLSVRCAQQSERLTADADAFTSHRVELSCAGQVPLTLDNASDARVFVGSPDVVAPASGPPRRVVVIGVDTLRPDHLSLNGYARQTSPELDAWATEQATVFDRAWAPAPRTRPSFRSATTGRQPLAAVGATTIGEVFDANGFATAGIVGNVHLDPRFDFPDGFGHWHLDNGAKANQQVDRALSWLRANQDRDTYLFLHIMDPHLFYVAPEPYGSRWVSDPDPELPAKYNRWAVYRWARSGALDARRKAHMEAAYDGEIAFTSAQLGRFLDGLDELGGNDLVVLHSDHGEEFWEHGGFEHNHTLYEELVRAVLWIRPPTSASRALARSPVTATLADIAPTLFDYAGFADTPVVDGLSLRPALEGGAEPGPSRALPIAFLMYGKEQWGVVQDDQKYILELATGAEYLYDLRSDPGELDNVAASSDLAPWRERLASAHGMPVGPGLRLDVRLGDEPLTLTLPLPVSEAGVLDPEASRDKRANRAWGEKARTLREDVALVEVSEDRTQVVLRPGEQGRGTVLLRFDGEVPTELRAATAEQSKPLLLSEPLRIGSHRLTLRASTVAFPQLGEAERMEALARQGDPDAQAMSLLEALGYVGGAEEDD